MSRCGCLFFSAGGRRRPDELQGLYECQVNTEPKINWPVTVHVEGKSHTRATSFLVFYCFVVVVILAGIVRGG